MLAQPPILSTDIYRYVWDGRMQAADINPYRHMPADPALATLRDTVIYPQINRADYARTIYPPVAQMVALPAIVAPSRALLWLATIPLLLIGEPVPGDRFFWPSLVYVPAILLLLAAISARGSRSGSGVAPK